VPDRRFGLDIFDADKGLIELLGASV